MPQPWVALGWQAPWLLQADQADQGPVSVLQVRLRVPQLPHDSLAAPGQLCPVQALDHWQLPPQAWVPPLPQDRVAPDWHAPSPPHADQAIQVPVRSSQVRVWVPQSPQAWVAAPVHCWLAHGLHWQLPPQLRIPPAPQLCMALGAQAASPEQAAHSLPTPLLQVRVWVPQLPQVWEAAPGQDCPVHSLQRQSTPQICVPLRPQACELLGAQGPSLPQVDQSDHLPS